MLATYDELGIDKVMEMINEIYDIGELLDNLS